MCEFITTRIEDGVLVATLNRPGKMNAITEPMYAALADQIDAAQGDSEIHVVLLLSEGDTFTAGNDISAFAGWAQAERNEIPVSVHRFLTALATTRKPLVAGVQGQAIGIGVTLLLHCDFVVVAHDAKLVAPFVNLALVPEAASTLLMVARIGHARAFALFAMGKPMDGDTAVSWGIANLAVEKGKVREEALSAAKLLASRPLGAMTATKQLMRDQESILAQIAAESQQFARQLGSPEAREVFQSFLAKRPPKDLD
ncbi:MAG TPA: enoyl-CoA hydratase-related protein [Paraburkholderia sp.]